MGTEFASHDATSLPVLKPLLADNSDRVVVQTSAIEDPNAPPCLLAKDTTHTSTPGKAQSKTLTWLELPEWQRDNEYILTGYRRYVFAPRL